MTHAQHSGSWPPHESQVDIAALPAARALDRRATQTAGNQTLGARGEAIAATHLEGLGMRVLARNWRVRFGELDLVMQDRENLVAVEVKTRSGIGYGSPLEAVTYQKLARLRRLLLEWARAHQVHAENLRVDVVGITLRPGRQPQIDHLRGVS